MDGVEQREAIPSGWRDLGFLILLEDGGCVVIDDTCGQSVER
jgi:hypothetical protein